MPAKRDPDKLAYNFFRKYPTLAPKNVTWEDGVVKYDYVIGSTPHRFGIRTYRALELIWGQVEYRHVDLSQYKAYMASRMDCPIVWDILENEKLNACADVYGDCTYENVVMTKKGPKLIDPGHARGFVCTENDLGKILQSQRGWENRDRVVPFDGVKRTVVASYITHLYRLLHHPEKHDNKSLLWANKEIDLAINYLGH